MNKLLIIVQDNQLSIIFILEQLENYIHPIIKLSIIIWKHICHGRNQVSPQEPEGVRLADGTLYRLGKIRSSLSWLGNKVRVGLLSLTKLS
jgi:hypothetical protein